MYCRKIFVLTKFKLLTWKKYLLNTIIALVVTYLMSLIQLLFSSTFVSGVNFYGTVTEFIFIVVIGTVVGQFITNLSEALAITAFESPENILYYGKSNWLISNILTMIINSLITLLILVLFLWSIYKIDIVKWLTRLTIMLFLAIPCTLWLALIELSLIFLFRYNIRWIDWLINMFIWSFFPIFYSLCIFPENIRLFYEIVMPPAGLIEEFRKIILLDLFDVKIFIFILISSLIWLVISYKIFNYCFDYSRKTGKLFIR